MVSARAYHAAYQVSVTGELIHLSWHSERLVISINQAAWCSGGPATVNNRCNPPGKHGELRYCVVPRPIVMSAGVLKMKGCGRTALPLVSGARDI